MFERFYTAFGQLRNEIHPQTDQGPAQEDSPAFHGGNNLANLLQMRQDLPRWQDDPQHSDTIQAIIDDNVPYQFDEHGFPTLVFTSAQATAYRRRIVRKPDLDPRIDKASIGKVCQNREYCIRRMVQAMFHFDNNVQDGKTSNDRSLFTLGLKKCVTGYQAEAACHALFDCVIDYCTNGYRGTARHDKAQLLRGKVEHVDDCTGSCEQRMENIIKALSEWKSVCRDVVFHESKHIFFAHAPLAYAATKKESMKNNESKKGKYEKGKKAEAEEKSTAEEAARMRGPDGLHEPHTRLHSGVNSTPAHGNFGDFLAPTTTNNRDKGQTHGPEQSVYSYQQPIAQNPGLPQTPSSAYTQPQNTAPQAPQWSASAFSNNHMPINTLNLPSDPSIPSANPDFLDNLRAYDEPSVQLDYPAENIDAFLQQHNQFDQDHTQSNLYAGNSGLATTYGNDNSTTGSQLQESYDPYAASIQHNDDHDQATNFQLQEAYFPDPGQMENVDTWNAAPQLPDQQDIQENKFNDPNFAIPHMTSVLVLADQQGGIKRAREDEDKGVYEVPHKLHKR